MLGIIGGTSLLFSTLPELGKQRMDTPFGSAEILSGDIVMLMRHQNGLPPHRINLPGKPRGPGNRRGHRDCCLWFIGVPQTEDPPGSLLVPTDYISLTDIPSIHDHWIEHVRPELSVDLDKELARIVPSARYGGVYVQTRGPRIETVAEVKALAWIADVVGMTVASEATLACELGMKFAALCTIENYANGLGDEVLTYEHIVSTSREHRHRTEEIVNTIIRKLG